MEYDSSFGALVRRKSNIPLDGIPLVTGISCLLKQFHPSTTRQLISYLGQFIRCTVQHALQENDGNNAKAVEIPKEVVNTILFLDHLCQYSSIPRETVYAYVPPYIFDEVKLAPKSTK